MARSDPMPRADSIDLSGQQLKWDKMARRRWRSSHQASLSDGDVWSTPPRAGDWVLRRTLGEVLGDDPSNVIITTGVRSAAFSLARPGDVVFHECPGFRGTVQALESAGARVEVCEWSRLASVIRMDKNRPFIWVTSPCRNPDGRSLSPAMMADFAKCQRGEAAIVINETYRWYRDAGDPVPGATYVASLSKIASGGARLGWIRGSDIEARFLPRHYSLAPMLWQRTWAYFIQDGGLKLLSEHTVRQAAASRQAFVDTAREVLPMSEGTDGPSVLYYLPSLDERTAVAQCLAQGLIVGAGRDFLSPRPALRMCFTGIEPSQAILAGRRFLQVARTWR